MKKILLLLIFATLTFANLTKDDVRKIIKEENMLLIHYIDKRFDDMQKENDIKFKAINQRLDNMQKEMDRKFKNIDRRFKDVDRRFDDIQKQNDIKFKAINQRFDEMQHNIDNRFSDLTNFLYILTGIFTTLTMGVIGFAYWDRRTIIRKAKEETIEEIEKEGKLKDLIKGLRELSKEDEKVALMLKNYGML